MSDSVHAALAGWDNFYLTTGSAAAALTGLQFVVQTLLASEELRSVSGRDPEGGIAAFGSPTVVHLSLVLIVSTVLCAPWPTFAGVRVALGVIGGGALVYAAVVFRRTSQQRSYKPMFEDWLWHVLLPAAAYVAVLVAALLVGPSDTWPLFIVAGATLLLLCAAIHNAWDTVTWLSVQALKEQRRQGARATAGKPDGASRARPRK